MIAGRYPARRSESRHENDTLDRDDVHTLVTYVENEDLRRFVLNDATDFAVCLEAVARLAERTSGQLSEGSRLDRVFEELFTVAINQTHARLNRWDARTGAYLVRRIEKAAKKLHPAGIDRGEPPRRRKRRTREVRRDPKLRQQHIQLPSPLTRLGYSVGLKGRSTSERHRLLSDFMETHLPPFARADYGEDYGEPGSAERLRLAVEWLAARCRHYKSKDPGRYAVAIAHYEQDLEYLRRAFFEADTMRFSWPQTEPD